MPSKKDYTGIKKNMLTAIKPDENKPGYWIFECECGTLKSIRPCNVFSRGETKSCGCLNRQKIHEPKNRKNLEGQHFGSLKVIKFMGIKGQESTYLCECKCGGEIIVKGSSLTSGNTSSCGCIGSKNRVNNVKKYTSKNKEIGTNIELCQKTEANANNKLGVRGVWFDKKTERYIAYITFKGHSKIIGRYIHIEDAISARKKAEEEIFLPFIEKNKQ